MKYGADEAPENSGPNKNSFERYNALADYR